MSFLDKRNKRALLGGVETENWKEFSNVWIKPYLLAPQSENDESAFAREVRLHGGGLNKEENFVPNPYEYRLALPLPKMMIMRKVFMEDWIESYLKAEYNLPDFLVKTIDCKEIAHYDEVVEFFRELSEINRNRAFVHIKNFNQISMSMANRDAIAHVLIDSWHEPFITIGDICIDTSLLGVFLSCDVDHAEGWDKWNRSANLTWYPKLLP